VSSPFDVPLVADPAVALPPLTIDLPVKTGPLYTVQFVVELVGPKSLPAAAAAGLLQPNWHAALGQPESWVMAPADTVWQPLTARTDGSYDSLALTWDFLSSRGHLSSTSATHLYSIAEQFGQAIERRAMPIPPPNDVSARVAALAEAQAALDIGFSIAVASTGGWIRERDIWIQAARLGLELAPDGVFSWRGKGWLEPVVSVTPLGDAQGFNLGAVQRGDSHPGVGVGFSVPRSPAPVDALNACFHVAQTFAAGLGCVVLDEDGEILSPAAQAAYRQNIGEAEKVLEQAGLAPGSAEALRLF
jgi:hypothetical protein